MNKFLMRISVIFFACTTLLLTACSSIKLRDHWQSEDFHKKDLDNVLIVGISSAQHVRILFEDGLASQLKAEGINAVMSHQVMGTSAPTKDKVAEYVKTHNIDYVIGSKVSRLKIQQDHVPESVRTYYTGPYYSSYLHFAGEGNTVTMVREPYTDTQTQVVLVTSIYDAKTEEILWTGQSETFEMHAISKVGGDVGKIMLQHIAR